MWKMFVWCPGGWRLLLPISVYGIISGVDGIAVRSFMV